jgi:hypothetical protein
MNDDFTYAPCVGTHSDGTGCYGEHCHRCHPDLRSLTGSEVTVTEERVTYLSGRRILQVWDGLSWTTVSDTAVVR